MRSFTIAIPIIIWTAKAQLSHYDFRGTLQQILVPRITHVEDDINIVTTYLMLCRPSQGTHGHVVCGAYIRHRIYVMTLIYGAMKAALRLNMLPELWCIQGGL